MAFSALLALVAAAVHADSGRAAVAAPLTRPRPAAATTSREAAGDTTRPRAVAVSPGYARRLAVHRWGSYAIVPLFGAQYALGDNMFRQKRDLRAGRRTEPIDGGLRTAHRVAAIGVGAVFAVNTVTGVWNLYDARGTEDKRRLRVAHSLLMLASDAGFVASGVLGADGRKHRNVAVGAMGVATLSAAMMLVFNRD